MKVSTLAAFRTLGIALLGGALPISQPMALPEEAIGTYGDAGQIVALRLRTAANFGVSKQTVHLVEAGGRLGAPSAVTYRRERSGFR